MAYPIATAFASSPRTTKFAVAGLLTLALGYAFTWFNGYLDRRSGLSGQPRPVSMRVLGHALMAAWALGMGYGFAMNSKLAMLAALACVWFADDFLLPERKRATKAPKRRQLPGQPGELTASEQALLQTALEERKKNTAAGVFFGSRVVHRRLLDMMQESGPVHTPSVLCALGSLAGYACQASLREHARNLGLEETAPFIKVEAADGKTYFYGDPLNDALAESKVSVWNLVATAAREAGCQQLPDMKEMFAHVTSTVGQPGFGVPRVPEKHSPRGLPLDMLRTHARMLLPLARKFCATPGELPILFAMALQDCIAQSKSLVPPHVAFLLAMESAIPMSKIDARARGIGF